MRAFFFDTESELFEPGCRVPRLVCMSYVRDTDEKASLVGRKVATSLLFSYLLDPSWLIVGHHVAHDMACCVEHDPNLLVPVFEAYSAGRIRCTMTREQLLAIKDGRLKATKLNLDALSQKYCGRALDKSEDSWRYRYGALLDVSLNQWPDAARNYATGDAWATRGVYEAQKKRAVEGDLVSPDEHLQTRAAWALHLMGAWGVRTEEEAVIKARTGLETKYNGLLKAVLDTDVYRIGGTKKKPKRVKNIKAIRARVEAAYKGSGRPVPMTDPTESAEVRAEENGTIAEGNIQYSAEVLKDSGDPVLELFAETLESEKLLTSFVPILEKGTKIPINPHWNVLVDTGRTSCSGSDKATGQKGSGTTLQNLPRKGGIRECFVPRPGHYYGGADYNSAELRSHAQILYSWFGYSDLKDALCAGRDVHLDMGAQLLGISYEEALARSKAEEAAQQADEKASVPVLDARQDAKCFHTDTEGLTPTGWRKLTSLTVEDWVIQATPKPGYAVDLEWVHPLDVFVRKDSAGKLVHLKNEGIDLRVTPDHDMLGYRKRSRTKKENGRRILLENLPDVPEKMSPYDLPGVRGWVNAGMLPGTLEVDERLLRLAVATQADGSFVEGGAIKFGFSKQRKIQRLETLLKDGEATRSIRLASGENNPKDATCFYVLKELGLRIRALLEVGRKSFPWWWLKLTPRLRAVVLDETRYWDGSKAPNWRMHSYDNCDQQSVDVLQALASVTNRKTRLVFKKLHEENHRPCSKLTIREGNKTRGGNLAAVEIPFTDDVVCLSVPSSFVLVRDGVAKIPVITGQCLNFGLPGGLGAETFVSYAKGYGRIISVARSRELKKAWLARWSEMRPYFNVISELTGDLGPGEITQYLSGRVRGRVAFTQAANGFFQSLTADGAKDAMYEISRRMYTEPTSALYGSRLVVFVHDEFIMESPIDKAAEATDELTAVMNEWMAKWIKDIPILSDPRVTRRWYKKAKEIRDASGRLVPWEPKKK